MPMRMELQYKSIEVAITYIARIHLDVTRWLLRAQEPKLANNASNNQSSEDKQC